MLLQFVAVGNDEGYNNASIKVKQVMSDLDDTIEEDLRKMYLEELEKETDQGMIKNNK